jgi:hypothetical protein
MKTKVWLPVITIFLVTFLTSCWTTKTNVGAYNETYGERYKYAKGKQVWIFWGLIPAGRTNVNTPKDGNCQVVTRFNVADILITALTGGIVTTYTIKVNAKRTAANGYTNR